MADQTYSKPSVPHIERRQEVVKNPQTGEDLPINESRVALDRQVIDPTHPDAVQIPEEAAVSHRHVTDPLDRPSPNEAFGDSPDSQTRPAKKSEKADK